MGGFKTRFHCIQSLACTPKEASALCCPNWNTYALMALVSKEHGLSWAKWVLNGRAPVLQSLRQSAVIDSAL